MQVTRRQILDILKRRGGGTVDELAREMELAPMTVRQHLAVLERDNLVKSREVRRQTGRPHYVYTLTGEGEDLFPKSYERLAEKVLREARYLKQEEMADLDGEKMVALLFQKLAHRMVAIHAPEMEGLALEQRVSTLTRICRERGTLAEWDKTGVAFIIREYNCPYFRVAQAHDDILCQWHLQFLAEALQADITLTSTLIRGDNTCRYLVREKTANAKRPTEPSNALIGIA
ncbi:MAG: helix-turn-helix domain-containing protein [Chloroflexi bacterium]|nr:helix-turn-helix domain-containing protein [Chloroflexota bacterium]